VRKLHTLMRKCLLPQHSHNSTVRPASPRPLRRAIPRQSLAVAPTMAHSDCGWTCGCAGKTVIPWEHVPYLSASAVLIHYEEALYQVYAPLPTKLLRRSLWNFYRNVYLDTEVIIKFWKSSGSLLRSRYLLYLLTEFLPFRGRAVLRNAVCMFYPASVQK